MNTRTTLAVVPFIVLLLMGWGSERAEALLADHDCSFCHDFHGSPDITELLSAANSELVCLSCHTVSGVAKAAAVHNPGGHASGEPGYITCRECHDAHSNRGSNVKLVGYQRDADNWSESFTAPGIRKELPSTAGLTYNVVTYTGPTDFNIAGSTVGVCEVCHAAPHGEGEDCTSCHSHADGFGAASCSDCHGNPPITNDTDGSSSTGLVHNPGPTTGTSPASAGGHAVHTSILSMTCETCHTGSNMPIVSNTIEMGVVINSTTWPGFGDTVTSGSSLNVQTSGNMGSFSYISSDGGTTVNETGAVNPTCSVYCHANWTGANGQTTVDWTGGAVITDDCNDCHGGSSATPPTRGSHQLHAGSGAGDLAMACSECHPNYSDTMHVDGNVAYDVSGLAGTSPTYRGNGTANSTGAKAPSASYGTCINYCHGAEMPSGDDSGVTDTGVVWGASNGSGCGFCHGDPPKSGASTSISAHGAVSAGDLTKCVDCHSDTTTDNGNPPTISATYHINGTLEVTGCTGCHGTDPKQYPPVSATATTGSDDAIGAHVVHIEKTATLMSKEAVGGEADLIGYWCAECHTTTRGAAGHEATAYPADVLFTNAVESKYGSVTEAFTAEGTIDNGIGGSCVTYCHSAYDGVAEKAGTNTQPRWTDLWANYGDGTPACSTACHLTPPFAGTTHDALAANDLTTCNGCHPDTVTNSAAVPAIGTAFHINGSIEASGDCNACHGYPSANGAHNKHAAKLQALGVGNLATSVTDTNWTAAAHPICAKCHDMSVAGNHTDETLPYSAPFDILIQTLYQFRSGTAPSYNPDRASQSCSSVECHFKPSPDWDTTN